VRLADKICLITGAGSGIGRASALAFAREGASVIVADVDEQAGARVAAGIAGAGGRAIAVRTDVTDGAACERAVAAALERWGRLDVLFNNAGIGAVGTVDDEPLDQVDRVWNVNVRGVFLMCRAALPSMMARRSGSIINMASAIAEAGLARRASYSASKGAVLALTRSMQVDYAPYNIRVNALLPGTVQTPLVERYLREHYPDYEQGLAGIRARQLTGELGRPEDVAAAAVFLAADESRFVMGSGLIIDGGLTGCRW
jgi:NAD(P)-dependent dehydrogenase (short-subunit alcohol dehydrogenase family)